MNTIMEHISIYSALFFDHVKLHRDAVTQDLKLQSKAYLRPGTQN